MCALNDLMLIQKTVRSEASTSGVGWELPQPPPEDEIHYQAPPEQKTRAEYVERRRDEEEDDDKTGRTTDE